MYYMGPDNFPMSLGTPPTQDDTPITRAEVHALLTNVKTIEVATIVLQAVAAFAALGIFLVQVQAMKKRK